MQSSSPTPTDFSPPPQDVSDDACTSGEWLRYFEENQRHLLVIPWEIGPELTASERLALGRSIREFQRGESSEGHHLYRYAQAYADRTGDRDYLLAIGLFIGEEQRHGRDLARFLGVNQLSLAKSSFSDRVFRHLRHLAGTLEISIAVLVTAEIIAQAYYAALREATGSRILRTLCDQILRDEASHVQFQAEQLGKLRARRRQLLYGVTLALHRFLFFGTCHVVWLVHASAFKQGGYGFRRFWRSAWLHFERAFATSAMVRDRFGTRGGEALRTPGHITRVSFRQY